MRIRRKCDRAGRQRPGPVAPDNDSGRRLRRAGRSCCPAQLYPGRPGDAFAPAVVRRGPRSARPDFYLSQMIIPGIVGVGTRRGNRSQSERSLGPHSACTGRPFDLHLSLATSLSDCMRAVVRPPALRAQFLACARRTARKTASILALGDECCVSIRIGVLRSARTAGRPDPG